MVYSATMATINGTDQSETLNGTDNNDNISPGNDYDTVYLCAGDGDGDGDDYFSIVSTEKILTEKFRFRCQ